MLTEAQLLRENSQRMDELVSMITKWQGTLLEVNLTQDQISGLFGDVAGKVSNEKTGLGKAATVAGKAAKLAYKALPSSIMNKLHDMIKDTKPVKDFDAAFERKKSELASKLGGDDSKIVRYTTQYAAWAKKHPQLQGAIIMVLTMAAAVATGPAGAAIVGSLLRTAGELMKGETLSKSIATGVGAGALGFLMGMGIRELGTWLNTFKVDSHTVPGYKNLAQWKLYHDHNGSVDVNIDTYLPDDAKTQALLSKVHKLQDLAEQAWDDNDFEKSAQLWGKIGDSLSFLNSPEYRNAISAMLKNNDDLLNKALEGAKKSMEAFNTIANAVQGAATAGAKGKQLDEADLKGMIGSIGAWAKKQAAQATQRFTPEKMMSAWKDAGSPMDSDDIHGILAGMGIPTDVLSDAFKASKIPLPKSKPAAKPKLEPKGHIKTGNKVLDAKVNGIMDTQGKDAAIKYLNDLKAKNAAAKAAPEPTAKPQDTGPVKASDGRTYNLSVGKAGDRIWLDAETGAEASDAIDAELEGKSKPAAVKPVTKKPTIKKQPAATAGQATTGLSEDDIVADLFDLVETASGGATASGSIASVANPMGGVISRTPNLFGYVPERPVQKRRGKRRKSARS